MYGENVYEINGTRLNSETKKREREGRKKGRAPGKICGNRVSFSAEQNNVK